MKVGIIPFLVGNIFSQVKSVLCSLSQLSFFDKNKDKIKIERVIFYFKWSTLYIFRQDDFSFFYINIKTDEKGKLIICIQYTITQFFRYVMSSEVLSSNLFVTLTLGDQKSAAIALKGNNSINF